MRTSSADRRTTAAAGCTRVGRRWRAGLALLLGLWLAAGVVAWGLRGIGYWLMVRDPLAQARAIVVLTGDFPFRAVEAASIYEQGWAAEVWLQETAAPEKEAVLTRLGFEVGGGEEVSNRRLLERVGVPPGAIQLLNGKVQNTGAEVQLVADMLRRVGGDQVILVTSKPHSRRVRATWRALVGESPWAIVRYAESDPFDAKRWWRNTGDALAVSRELFGLMNVWAGFPVQPNRVRSTL